MKQVKEKEKSEVPKQTEGRFAKAVVKFLRIAPRKVRLVINPIRHRHPEQAFQILMTFKKKAARMVEKLLKTAVANAKVLGLDEAKLTIFDVRADGGPVMKRFMERSMGRANRIVKRTTHLTMILKEGQKTWNLPSGEKSAEAGKQAPQPAKTIFGRKKKEKAAGSKV